MEEASTSRLVWKHADCRQQCRQAKAQMALLCRPRSLQILLGTPTWLPLTMLLRNVAWERWPGHLTRPMLVSSNGGDIPQPSLMATLPSLHLLPVVASVRSMLPPSPVRTRYVALGNYDSDDSRMSRRAVILKGGLMMDYFWALGSNDTLQQQCMTLPHPVAKATATYRDRGT
jgi:hypothetical protein